MDGLPIISDPVISDPVHPLGARAKVLLSSVFGPYAQDDEFGSRRINPMELFHNQVTRVQGAFSYRTFHSSAGLMLLQANIDAPCTLLDFPTLDRFIEEIRDNHYDIVGISSIAVNRGKVKKMCELVRRYLPQAKIIIGGHLANMPDLAGLIDADHIVRGDGVRWFRKYLQQDENAPLRHPMVYSSIRRRALGINLSVRSNDAAATILPTLGCPVGCNFCSTSATFGGKGKFVKLFDDADELFSLMCKFEKSMKVQSFFVLDENFLIHRPRALRLLELMRKHDKSWTLYIFSSAQVLQSYTIEQLIGLGVSWVWIGLEGAKSQYTKLVGVDTKKLVKRLQSHGIRVLGSSIIGLESHTPANIDEVIDYAIGHEADFNQFMLYTPVPGTPLYEQHRRDGTLLSEDECPTADYHGQFRFNYRHPHIKDGQEAEMLLRAFNMDFKVNGPSLVRCARTILQGWRRYKSCSDKRVRARCIREAEQLPTLYSAVLWASRKWYAGKRMEKKIGIILQDFYDEFGVKARIVANILGPILFTTMKREEKRLADGWTLEPPTQYRKNKAAFAMEKSRDAKAEKAWWAVPTPV